MKKLFSYFLCLLVILACFSVCSTSSPAGNHSSENSSQEKTSGEPLLLCADFGIGSKMSPAGGDQYALERFLRSVADCGGPKDVEIELIPSTGSERQTALNRIRVELMSGTGPDLFITNCPSPGDDLTQQALFQFPEQAMDRGLFLKLDEYIEAAQFMEWDKLTPAVMDAGKTEDGQFLLPLAYSLPVTFFLSSDVQPYPADTTWAQTAEGSDSVLGLSMDRILDGVFPVEYDGFNYFSYTWKELADDDTETLLISEAELLQRAKEALSLEENGAKSAFPHYRGVLDKYMFHSGVVATDPVYRELLELRQSVSGEEPVTMIPLYCDQGGAVAAVQAFAGVNAGTKRPGDAFFVLDVLLSRTVQENSALSDMWCYMAMPVHEEIAFDQPENVFSAFGEARSQIVSARFPTPLDALLNEGIDQYRTLQFDGGGTEADLTEIMAETYGKMKQTLNES